MGLLFAGFGVLPILGSLGIVPLRNELGVPGWVGVCTGLLFVLAGAGIINGYAVAGGAGADGDLPRGTPFAVRLIQYLLGLGVAGLLTTIIGWVAFGPGERRFSISLYVPFLAERWAGDDTFGRLAFGIGAALMFAIFVALAIVGAKRLRRSSKPRRHEEHERT